MQSYENIIGGKQSLLEWIRENATEEGLQKPLPDKDSVSMAMPSFEELSRAGLNFVDGMLDGVVGMNRKEQDSTVLVDMFEDFASVDSDELSDDSIDDYLGRIYLFIIQHRTLNYIDNFLEAMLKEGEDKRLLHFCFLTAKRFLLSGIHREAIKFGIAVCGVFELDEEILAVFCLFGLADEFARFVGLALARHGLNGIVFALAQQTKGWGRIAYLDFLEVSSQKIREWIIFEGYKCDIGIDHVALVCLEKGDLPGYIKENGFNSRIYTAAGDIINSFCGLSKVGFDDYPHSSELVELFVRESKNQAMDLKKFAILCELISPIKEDLDYDEKIKEELIDCIKDIAFNGKIDWESLVRSDVFNYDARTIAEYLDFDIWEDMFNKALEDKEFKQWYPLTLSRDKERYKRLCDLVKERFDLESLKSEPKDELGLSAEFSVYDDLVFIVQNLGHFDEVIGLEIIETCLQSPVTRSRNMALNTIESYLESRLEIPQSIIEILEKNKDKEPKEDIRERYEKILQRYLNITQNINPCGREECNHEWHLCVEGEFNHSGLWRIVQEDEVRRYYELEYDELDLDDELVQKFQQWRAIYDEYGERWNEDKAKPSLQKLYEDFNEKTLELAKELKQHFKGKAYVEIWGDNEEEKEIRYYYMKADYGCAMYGYTLDDDEVLGTSIEGILEDDFGLDISEQREEIERLDEELEEWSYRYSNLADNGSEWREVTDAEVLEQGRILAERVRQILPRYCVVEYRK